MAEVGCLKDGMFNNLEVHGSLILRDGSSVAGGSTSNISIVEDPHNGANDVLLTPEMSGSIIKISTANQGQLNLPNPQLGLNYKFILTDSSGNNTRPINSMVNGVSTNLMFGIINNTGTVSLKPSSNIITFDPLPQNAGGSRSTPGDFIELYCVSTSTTNGSKTWFVNAVTSTTDGIV